MTVLRSLTQRGGREDPAGHLRGAADAGLLLVVITVDADSFRVPDVSCRGFSGRPDRAAG